MSKPSQRSEKVPPGAVPRAEIPRLEDWNQICSRVAPEKPAKPLKRPIARAPVRQLELPFE